MARNRDPFTQALSSLRDRIRSGELAGGRPVIVQDEARRLHLSTTPIREALARLSGEGLVERAPSGGYVSLRLDATTARDRYAMRGEYIRIALALNGAALGHVRPPPPPFNPGLPGPAVARLFATIVCSAGNHVLWTDFVRVTGQLEFLSSLEAALFDDLDREAQDLRAAYGAPGREAFANAVARFHARRVAAAGALTAVAYLRGDTSPPSRERGEPPA